MFSPLGSSVPKGGQAPLSPPFGSGTVSLSVVQVSKNVLLTKMAFTYPAGALAAAAGGRLIALAAEGYSVYSVAKSGYEAYQDGQYLRGQISSALSGAPLLSSSDSGSKRQRTSTGFAETAHTNSYRQHRSQRAQRWPTNANIKGIAFVSARERRMRRRRKRRFAK